MFIVSCSLTNTISHHGSNRPRLPSPVPNISVPPSIAFSSWNSGTCAHIRRLPVPFLNVLLVPSEASESPLDNLSFQDSLLLLSRFSSLALHCTYVMIRHYVVLHSCVAFLMPSGIKNIFRTNIKSRVAKINRCRGRLREIFFLFFWLDKIEWYWEETKDDSVKSEKERV